MQCSIGFFNDVPMAVLFITVGLGYAIGKLHIGPIALGGVCGTLIVALLVGQTGCQLHGELKDVAFALFIFAMGYSGGPHFFANLNRSSLRFMLLPLIEAFVVLAIVLTATRMLHLDAGTAAGLAAGAATESAVVGTAAEALRHLGLDPAEATRMESNIATAYTLTYLVGLVSIVFFTSQVAPLLLRFNLREASKALATKLEAASEDDVATQPALPRVVGRAYRVERTAGLTVRELEAGLGGRTQVIGLFRDNAPVDVQPDLRMERGDIAALIACASGWCTRASGSALKCWCQAVTPTCCSLASTASSSTRRASTAARLASLAGRRCSATCALSGSSRSCARA